MNCSGSRSNIALQLGAQKKYFLPLYSLTYFAVFSSTSILHTGSCAIFSSLYNLSTCLNYYLSRFGCCVPRKNQKVRRGPGTLCEPQGRKIHMKYPCRTLLGWSPAGNR